MRNWIITTLPLVALAACSSETEQAPDPASETEETAATGTADGAADTTEPVLSAEGWGPLRIGMTLDQVSEAVGPDANPEAIGGPEPEFCDQFRPERAPEGMLVMIEEGVLTRITVTENGAIETDAGLSVGDSAEAVRAAYGERLQAEPHKYLERPAEYLTMWTVGGAGDEPYIEDPAARGIRYETDLEQRVERIHVGGPSIQYVEGCL